MNTGYASKDKPWRKYYTDDELNLEVPDMSLTDYITKLNKDRLYLTALNYLNKKITYEELLDNIDKTSKRFQALGVKEEDYVSLAMPLTPETIYFIYGLDKIGANANLIDPRIPEEKMRFYLNLAKTKLSFVVSSYAETMINASRNTSTKSVYDVSPIAFLSKEEKLQQRFIECLNSFNINAISECIKYLDELPFEVIDYVLSKTSGIKCPNWNYANTILQDYVKRKIDSVEKIQAEESGFKNQKQDTSKVVDF